MLNKHTKRQRSDIMQAHHQLTPCYGHSIGLSTGLPTGLSTGLPKGLRVHNNFSSRLIRRHQSGAVMLMSLAAMIMMLGITALVIDISRLHVIKQEMQNAADAGALRGANVLVSAPSQAVTKATDASQQNRVQQSTLQQAEITARSGFWSGTTWQELDPSSLSYAQLRLLSPAVKVNIAKLNIPLLFARLFGLAETPLQVQAIAVAPSPDQIAPGGLTMPIAVYQDYLDTINLQNRFIVPTDETSIALWGILQSSQHTSPCTSVNDTCLSAIVARTYQQPSAKIGDSIRPNTGVVNSVLDETIRNCWQSNCAVNIIPVINNDKRIVGFLCTKIVGFIFSGNTRQIEVETSASGCPSGEVALNGGPNYGVYVPSKLTF
jgi:hypothetical protein